MVDKDFLTMTLDYAADSAAEASNVWRSAFVYLVSAVDGDPDDDYEAFRRVGISYLILRAYTLLEGLDWPIIYRQAIS